MSVISQAKVAQDKINKDQPLSYCKEFFSVVQVAVERAFFEFPYNHFNRRPVLVPIFRVSSMHKRPQFTKTNTLQPDPTSNSRTHENSSKYLNRPNPHLAINVNSRSKSKSKNRKLSSGSLFKEAHVAKKGETYLSCSPSSSQYTSIQSKKQQALSSVRSKVTDLKRHKSQDLFDLKKIDCNMEINRKVLQININAPAESDLTRLIIQELGSAEQTIAGMSILEPVVQGDKQLVKRLSSTNESIRNILNMMK